jgi:hypothetical protein
MRISNPKRSGCVSRLARRAVLASLLIAGAGAHALTFTAGSSLAFSGGIGFLTPGIATIDTPNGFILRGDYQTLGNGFIIGYRPFQIGLLPERIDSFATENFKIVVAGGPSGAPGDGELRAQVNYRIEPDPLGPVLPDAATPTDVKVTGNGLLVVEKGVAELFDGVLPSSRILAPGNYVLRTFIELTYSPGTPAAYPVAGFIELGGLNGGFTGLDASIIGTPVPEPTSFAMVAAGLGALAWRAQARKRKAA